MLHDLLKLFFVHGILVKALSKVVLDLINVLCTISIYRIKRALSVVNCFFQIKHCQINPSTISSIINTMVVVTPNVLSSSKPIVRTYTD